MGSFILLESIILRIVATVSVSHRSYRPYGKRHSAGWQTVSLRRAQPPVIARSRATRQSHL